MSDRRWQISIRFYWRDLWIGVYVAPDNGESQSTFICPVPGVVIEIEHFNE